MRAVVLLCDAAQVCEGKLYILGGGWSVSGPGPIQMAVAVKVDVDWNETNQSHRLDLELLDDAGEPFRAPGPSGDAPIRFEVQFEVGRPPGVSEGTRIVLPFAFPTISAQLPPASRFTWRLSIDDRRDPNWETQFTTRPPVPGQPPFGSGPQQELPGQYL